MARPWKLRRFAAGALLALTAAAQPADPVGEPLPAWRAGELDIHHISTGSGNATFFVLPDGTTMLIDAGDVDRASMRAFAPLKLQAQRPDASRRAGQWIADYIRQFTPAGQAPRLDYALVTHFHSDHFGKLLAGSPRSKTGAYRLTGIMDVADLVPIGTLIDRAGPGYHTPVNLRACSNNRRGTMANYFAFVDHRLAGGEAVEALVPGRSDQIMLRHHPDLYPRFTIRNIAASGAVWTGKDGETRQVVPLAEAGGCTPDENPLSLAIRLSYGPFDYFSGGDLTGLAENEEPRWRDVETEVARVVGPVDALLLDHHGNRDATNANLLRALAPRVLMQETWISDQPGGEVVHRMISPTLWPGPRDIFATGMLAETRIAIGPWMERNYRSFSGHVVLRVAPGGASYDVYALEDEDAHRLVKAHFGPYQSR